MSADLINLRQARKVRARAGKDANAAGNRAKFGRTKAERELQGARDTLEQQRLDGHRLEAKPKTPGPDRSSP